MSEKIYKVTLEKCKELETETGKFLIWKLPGSHWMIIRTIKLNKSKKKKRTLLRFYGSSYSENVQNNKSS